MQSPLSRRSLLSLFTLGLTARIASAHAGQVAALEPGPGEILLEGKITGGSRKDKKMTLLVDRVVSANGTPTKIEPPRSRDVQLTEKTTLVNVANAAQSLVPEGLMLAMRVSVIGKDLGSGQLLSTRLILVETDTLEQRTLLEQGQMAVATQTFTHLGDKSWWNFRCSDAAKATMTAYRGGLKMTVDQAAQSYDVQLQHGDVAVSEGDLITVAFRARADRARSLHVEAQAAGGDYPDIGLTRDVHVGADWQPYTFTFTARKIGKRNQIVWGLGQERGTIWMETVSVTVAPSGAAKPVEAKPRPVARSGKTTFTGALVSQIDLFSVVGKRYDFARGGAQPFTLLLSSEEEPITLVPITLTARTFTEKVETEEGTVTVRTLDWRREGETTPVGYLMIGPDGEVIKAENTASFFPEPMYLMQGPAAKTPQGFEMKMLEPYRDRWRIEKNGGNGWKISVSAADGTVVAWAETDGKYNPTRIRCPLGGYKDARVFSATIAEHTITWDLPLR